MTAIFPAAALYVHIPFCRSRCIYCDFNTYGGVGEAERGRYHRALLQDLNASAQLLKTYSPAADTGLQHFWMAGPRAFLNEGLKYAHGRSALKSIYFGGGTPSYAPAVWLSEILDGIKKVFPVDEAAEITFEANPGTLCPQKLYLFRQAGFNRMSLGVQSLDDKLLHKIGRIHNACEAVQAVSMARRAGFDNINLDLIYGLPGQTETVWRTTLQGIIELRPEHISCYALSVEEGTPLEKKLASGIMTLPGDDECEAMENTRDALLSANGYRQYEISNYARDGKYCIHNLIYWNNLPYLGVGAGAVSYINGWRMTRQKLPDRYAELAAGGMYVCCEGERLSLLSRWREYLMLGLRTVDGINTEYLWERFPKALHCELKEWLQSFCAELPPGLLKAEGRRLYLSQAGLRLSNEIFVRILEDGELAHIFRRHNIDALRR
ncbi:radical SAM family heme chaperone HemW [bacterium]|nr:radical SAM family heme chaperone HemW [bacterium]